MVVMDGNDVRSGVLHRISGPARRVKVRAWGLLDGLVSAVQCK